MNFRYLSTLLFRGKVRSTHWWVFAFSGIPKMGSEVLDPLKTLGRYFMDQFLLSIKPIFFFFFSCKNKSPGKPFGQGGYFINGKETV